MTNTDQEFRERCDRLFATLSRGYLNKMAFFLGWSQDDLQQEFRLLCWEVEAGVARFDASKGDLPGYFVGRLRKKLHKNLCLNFALPVEDDDQAGDSRSDEIQQAAACPSVLDHLVDRETQSEAEQTAQEEDQFNRLKVTLSNRTAPSNRQSWILKLWQQGLSQDQIARVGGLSQSFVSRYLSGKGASDPPEPDPGQGVLF